MEETTRNGVEFDRRRLEAAAAALWRSVWGSGPGPLPAERKAGRLRGSRVLVRNAHPPRFPDPEGCDVCEVTEPAEAPFGAIVAAGFGLEARDARLFAALPGRPEWRCYLATVSGEPAAVGSMFLDSDLAVFALDATLESSHGSGCQMALLRRRIADAAAAGARILCIEPAELDGGGPSPTYGNALRAGFELAYEASS